MEEQMQSPGPYRPLPYRPLPCQPLPCQPLPLRPLTPQDADAVAHIHAAGQSGTFLTSLGLPFLRKLYEQMAVSPHCFGWVAYEGDEVVGVMMGTVDSGAVFKELIWRRGAALALPVAWALLHHPSLLPKIVQTLFYPSQTDIATGEAEVLFVGVRPDRRSKGLGRALFGALVQEARRRGLVAVCLMVDAQNTIAQHLYRRIGMEEGRHFILYGREMIWYRLPLKPSEETNTEPSMQGQAESVTVDGPVTA